MFYILKMSKHWILDERGKPVPEEDLAKWASWFGKSPDRVVKQEMVGESRVSTVFLGIDHSFNPLAQEPVLWETMVFGGELDQEQERCSGNRAEAEAMHEEMVRRVKEKLGIKRGK